VTRAAGRSLLGISTPLASTYDVALLDLDGVVYVGPDPIPSAAPALAMARAAGMRLAFVTNNASRDPAAVAAHLVALGVPADADEVVTSSQAAATVLVERLGAGASVLVTGSAALRTAVELVGLRVVPSSDDKPDAVVQGYSPDLRYADLAEAALAVRAGAFWVATNTDSTLPSARGLLPGNGSLVAAVAVATGRRPTVAGKPQLPMHAEGVRRTGAQNPLVVGDRLDTDIEGANVADTDSLLVLTGVTAAVDLVDAPVKHRPTFLALDLTGLVDTQPDVEPDGAGTRCGGWTAVAGQLDGRVAISVDGDGRPIDGLRALLTAAWAARDAGAAGVDASDSLRRLGFS
jgi:HAD superfamily hydrolase (TIGR01450 family)